MALKDKLEYLNETKQAIKQAIIDKGQAVADADTFRSYAEKISAIEAGGGGGAYDIEQVINPETGTCELRITDAVGGEPAKVSEIKVNLPSELALAANIFHFKANDEIILFGSSLNIGLWEYNKSKNIFTQIWATGHYFQYFKIIDNKCLISTSSDSAQGLFVYDITEKTVQQIYTRGRQWIHFQQIENHKWLIGTDTSVSGGGLLLYNSETQAVKSVMSASLYGLNKFQKIGNDWLIGGARNASSVYLYESATETTRQIYNESFYNFYLISETKCLMGATGSGLKYGIAIYDHESKTSTKIYETGVWGNFVKVGNDCLIASTTTSGADNAGILLYNGETGTITKIYENGYAWGTFCALDNVCLIGSNNSNSKGLLMYESLTNTITMIDGTDTFYYLIFFKVSGTKALLSGIRSNGIWLYNAETNEFSTIYSAGNSARLYFYEIDNDCLIYSRDSYFSGILLFDGLTEEITKIYNSTYGWVTLQEIGNDLLLSESNSYKQILVYNGTEKTITAFATADYYYANFKLDNKGNAYITTTKDHKTYPLTYYYDGATKTISAVGYYVEVE